jgi:ketosteroid isomerase-like protein
MSEQNNVNVMQKWFAAINARDHHRLIELFDKDEFIWEMGNNKAEGREISREAWRLFFAAFPDIYFEPIQIITSDDYVVSRYRMRGTHTGEFRFRDAYNVEQIIVPTNRKIDIPSCAVSRIRGKQIIHLCEYWDTLSLWRQLDIPPPEGV